MESLRNTNRYGSSILKTHEAQIQQLRHERKTESKHLDELKKGLRTKLVTKGDDGEIRVA